MSRNAYRPLGQSNCRVGKNIGYALYLAFTFVCLGMDLGILTTIPRKTKVLINVTPKCTHDVSLTYDLVVWLAAGSCALILIRSVLLGVWLRTCIKRRQLFSFAYHPLVFMLIKIVDLTYGVINFIFFVLTMIQPVECFAFFTKEKTLFWCFTIHYSTVCAFLLCCIIIIFESLSSQDPEIPILQENGPSDELFTDSV